jgi:hypothetical protein
MEKPLERVDLIAISNRVLADVVEERHEQIVRHGWNPAHDDTHKAGELARAAACYAIPEPSRVYATRVASGHPARVPALWPWEVAGWKPTPGHRRRELVKAAALLLAEIERIDRDVARHGEWVR